MEFNEENVFMEDVMENGDVLLGSIEVTTLTKSNVVILFLS